jgi:hypothetical protein
VILVFYVRSRCTLGAGRRVLPNVLYYFKDYYKQSSFESETCITIHDSRRCPRRSHFTIKHFPDRCRDFGFLRIATAWVHLPDCLGSYSASSDLSRTSPP